MLKLSGTSRQRAATLLMAVLALVVFSQAVALAQNLGAAPQVNVAVQGQTGAQPEGAFLNLVKHSRRFAASLLAAVSARARYTATR